MAGERTFAAVFARLHADRTGLVSDLRQAVKDAGFAGGQIENSFNRPVAKGLTSSLQGATLASRGFAQGLLSDVDPALAQLATQSAFAVQATSKFGPVTAGAVGGVTALVGILGLAIAKSREAADAQIAYTLAVRQFNTGGLTAEIQKALEAQERFRVNAATAARTDPGLPFEKFVANVSNALTPLDEVEARATRARTALSELYNAFGKPVKESQLRQGLAAFAQQAAAFRLAEATSADEINGLLAEQITATRAITQEQQLQRKLAAEQLAKQKEPFSAQEAADIRRGAAAENALAAKQQEQAEAALTRAAQDRLKVETGFLAVVRKYEAERVELVEERRARELTAVGEVQAAQARSAEERLGIEQRVAGETARLEEEAFHRRSAFLQREIEETRTAAGFTNDERRQKLAELEQLLAQHEEKRLGAAAAAGAKQQVLAQSLADARAATEDKLFANALAMGERSLQDSIDRNKKIADDANRTADARIDAARRAFEEEQRLRDDSRGAASGLLGDVMKRLGADDTNTITKGAIEDTINTIKREKEFNAGAAQSALNTGQPVSFGALKQGLLDAGDLQKFQNQQDQLGGVDKIFQNAFKVSGPAGESINEFRKLFGDMTIDIIKSFESVPDAVSGALDTINDRIAKGTARIRETLYDQFVNRLTRDLQAEAKRF